MANSRSEYVVKNAATTVTIQLVKNLLDFVGRIIFVRVLGAEYLGVNSLFTQILTVLSFAELGVGNAMIFSLYKPLAEKDREKIKSLMRLYALSYRIIGIVIAVAGLCIIPFLDLIVGEVSYVKENIVVLYLLFLINTVVSYFFVYNRSLIVADQKTYLVSVYTEMFHALRVIAQSIFLVVTKSIIPYLVIMIICTLLNNLFVTHKANTLYPYLKDKDAVPLDKSETKGILSNVKALVVYKIGTIMLESTDSIFISVLVNVLTVGLYTNYKMIINVFKTVGNQVMESIIASIGNLNAEATKEKKLTVFNDIYYINAWFYGFTAVGLGLFLTPVIKIFFGADNYIAETAVWASCLYYYVANLHYPCYAFRTTSGLFVYGKFVPLACTILNVILDIVLGIKFQLVGIVLASVISRMLTFEIIDPLLVFKRVFNHNPIGYFVKYILYFIITAVDAVACYFVINHIPIDGILGLIVKVIVVTIVYNLIFLLVTCRSASFADVKNRMLNMIKSKGLKK